MKAIKKLTAVLLSVILLLGVVVVPVAAEDTAEETVRKYYSLFDLSDVKVGAKTSGDADALPAGVDESGIMRYNANMWNESFYDGTQEVVKVDGKKALKVNFDVLSYQGRDLGGTVGIYSIKMPIPAGLGQYVSQLTVSMDNYAGDLKYRLGVLSGEKAGNDNLSAYAYGAATSQTVNVTNNPNFYTYTDIIRATNYGTAYREGAWDSTKTPIEYVYFIMTDNSCKTEPGTGYVLLKDISITVDAPQSVYDNLPINKTFDLLDLSSAAVGEFNDAMYPEGVSEFQLGSGGTVPELYSGEKRIEANEKGENVLQLDLEGLTHTGANANRITEGKYNQVYAIKLKNIPAAHLPYISSINLKLKKSADSQARVLYEFGFTDDNLYSRSDLLNNRAIEASANGVTESWTFSDLRAVPGWCVGWGASNYDKGDWVDRSYTGLFLAITADTAQDAEAGTLQIEELSYTVAATEEQWANIKTEKTFDLLDLSDVEIGEYDAGTVPYPDGVSEMKFSLPQHSGKKNIVEDATTGKKVLQLDLNDFVYTEADSKTYTKYKDRMSEWYTDGTTNHNQAYSLQFANIPADHIKNITGINIKLKKSVGWSSEVIFEYGVYGQTGETFTYSKRTHTNANYAGASGSTYKTYVPTELSKITNKGKVQGHIDVTNLEKWNNTFTGIFLTLTAHSDPSATVDMGTLQIEELSYTVAATEEEWASMPVEKKFNLLDLSGVEEGVITSADYPIGISEWTTGGWVQSENKGTERLFDGDKKVVVSESGNKVLQLDFASAGATATNPDSNLIDRGGYSDVYAIRLSEIPSTYIPLIKQIKLKMKKTAGSEAKILYEFGVSNPNAADSLKYSKKTVRVNNNEVVDATNDKMVKVAYNPAELYRVKDWQAFEHVDTTETWADASYTSIFLAVTAYAEDPTKLGALNIEEISYTISGTDAQLAAADEEWEDIKATWPSETYCAEDFEDEDAIPDLAADASGVIETTLAPGGTKAYKAMNHTVHNFDISNPNMRNADGVSFWIYNPNNETRSYNFELGTSAADIRYVHSTNVYIPAKSYRKIEFDFANIYKDANIKDSKDWVIGDNVSLNAARRAEIDKITVYARQTKEEETAGTGNKVYFYIDDIYVYYNGEIKTREVADVAINSQTATLNGAAATFNADGKIVIPASASMQTIEVSVPKGSLSNASDITFNLTSAASADVSLRFYAKTVLDANRTQNGGEAAYIKAGANPWQFTLYNRDVTLKVDGKEVTGFRNTISQKMFFSDPINTWNVAIPFEHTGIFSVLNEERFDQQFNTWTNHNLPTSTEKAAIDTLCIDIQAFGDATNPDDYIVLDSIDFVSQGVTITTPKVTEYTVGGKVLTATQPLGYQGQTYQVTGRAEQNIAREFPGETTMVYAVPDEGYYLYDITAVDHLGEDVPLTKVVPADGANAGTFYSLVVPNADVTVTPVFKKLNGTLISEINYNKNDFELSYVTPVVNKQVYNEVTGYFENLVNCGVIVVGSTALEKYGLTEDDLTKENVEMWIATGHNIANYIFEMDESDIIGDITNDISNIVVRFTDITPEMRKNVSVAVAKYANFKDDNGEETEPLDEKIVNTFDCLVYGDLFTPDFYAEKGINYTSVSTDIAYMQELAGLGIYDHIRLVRRADVEWDYGLDADGNFTEAYLESTDKIIQNALKCGFSVVLDLHSLANLSGDFEKSADKYRNAWDTLAKRYAAYPESVVFELINEPKTDLDKAEGYDPVADPDPMTVEELNNLQIELINKIRAIDGNANRKVVVGKNWNDSWNITDFSAELLNMENIIVDFHYYSPMSFSHSGQDGRPAGATDWGTIDTMDAQFKQIRALANTYGVEVWIGEWGAYQADSEKKLEYYEAMLSKMAEYEIPWAVWASTDIWSGWNGFNWDPEIIALLGRNY